MSYHERVMDIAPVPASMAVEDPRSYAVGHSDARAVAAGIAAEADTEVARLKAIIRVNGRRMGASHEEIDAMIEGAAS